MNSVTSQEIAIEKESLQLLWRKKLYREKNWPKYQNFLNLYTGTRKRKLLKDDFF